MNVDLAQLQDFAQRYTAAWCSQTPESVAEFYSPAGSLTVNNGAPAVGRTAIVEIARSFMTAFPDLRVMMEDVVPQGEQAKYQWTLIGTHTGPGGRVTSTLTNTSVSWLLVTSLNRSRAG